MALSSQLATLLPTIAPRASLEALTKLAIAIARRMSHLLVLLHL